MRELFPNASQSFLNANATILNAHPKTYRITQSPKPEPAVRKCRTWTKSDDEALINYYTNTQPEDFRLEELAKQLGRTRAFVCRKAGKMGLTSKTRCSSVQERELSSSIQKGKPPRHQFAGFSFETHPRGMKGKRHTEETKARISEAHKGIPVPAERLMRILKTKQANGTLIRPRSNQSWKQGWVEIGGQRLFARSNWEANYGRYLEWLKTHGHILDWEHEPETFWFEKVKRGTRSYLPDFRVTSNDGSIAYHEVKGYMDRRSKTKLKRMRIYHPSVTVVLIDAPRYRALQKTVGGIVPGWASKAGCRLVGRKSR